MKTEKRGRIMNIKNILIGLVSGIGMSLVLGAIAAAIVAQGAVGEGMIVALCAIIHFLASFGSGMITGKISQVKKGVYAAATSGLYLLLWVGAAILFWDGIQTNFEHALIAAIAGAVLAWLLLVVPKGRNRHKYIKRFS